jgi:hypothetical protein
MLSESIMFASARIGNAGIRHDVLNPRTKSGMLVRAWADEGSVCAHRQGSCESARLSSGFGRGLPCARSTHGPRSGHQGLSLQSALESSLEMVGKESTFGRAGWFFLRH